MAATINEKIIHEFCMQVVCPIVDEVIAKYYRAVSFDVKGDGSIVSIADREIETKIREAVEGRFVGHVVCGEEEKWKTDIQKTFRWVVDPIDGTTSFAISRATFMTLVAVVAPDDSVIYSFAYQPILKEVFCTQNGMSYLNGAQIKTNKDALSIKDCTIACTGPNYLSDADFAFFSKLGKSAKTVVYGGDSYLYSLLALGKIDVVFESTNIMKVWDIAPFVRIVEHAGGVVCNRDGNRIEFDFSDQYRQYNMLAFANKVIKNLILDSFLP